MSYVEHSLLNGENVVFETRLHRIIFFPSVIMAAIAILLYVGGITRAGNVFLGLAALLALSEYFVYKSSEFAVTNKRVVIKVGILQTRTLETLLSKVEAISVEQGIIARIFGYGTIVVIGTGGTKEPFKRISAPMKFRRAVQSQST